MIEAAAIVFLIIWGYFWFRIDGRKREYEVRLAEKEQRINELNTDIKQLSEEHSELKEQQDTLIELILRSNSIDTLKVLLFETEGNSTMKKEGEIELHMPKENKFGAPKRFYFPIPEKDSTFKDSNSTAFNATKHMYQFIILSEQGTKARFKFINHELTTKDALNDPQQYLRPVCNYENTISAESSQIITVEEGWADKKDNIWTVTQKALIKFE